MATKLQLQEKTRRRDSRHFKIRKNLAGTSECPRLVVFRSNASIYAQLVDDTKGFTLVQSSSRELKDKAKKAELSKLTGKKLAEAAKAKGITSVVFDRNGYLYHGRVKALAEGAREGGLQF